MAKTGEPDLQLLETAWGMYQRGQYADALRCFLSLDERGSLSAAVYIGYMHQRGMGIPKDAEKASRYFSKAANAGSADGQYYLGALLQSSNDLRGAEAWYAKAAAQLNPSEALVSPHSSQGALSACVKLGYIYHRGLGVPVDVSKARRLYLRAAQAGSAEAQHYLGALCRERGELVEALQWSEKAAEQAHVSANYWTYVMYERGEGSERDTRKAHRYLLRAEQLGHVYAQRARAMQLVRGAEGWSGALRGFGMFASSLWRGFTIAYRDPTSPLIH